MRYPRLSAGRALPPSAVNEHAPLVAVAHGSRDPRAAATVQALLDAVAARARDLEVRAAFLDHCAPSLPQVLGSLTDNPVVVPLLLTAAYHSKSDIPAQLAAATAAGPAAGPTGGLTVRLAATLGPHPLLLTALERRLREAGVRVDSAADRARTAVVLAAAGSSDPAANATIADLAARWQRERGWRAVVPAYASAAGPTPAEAVAALRVGDGAADDADADLESPAVVVASYLLAPGYFADKIRAAALAAGADAVSEVLGAGPEVADVVLARYREALPREAVFGAARSRGALYGRAMCERLRPDPEYAAPAVVTARLVTCPIRGNPRGTDLPARAPRRA